MTGCGLKVASGLRISFLGREWRESVCGSGKTQLEKVLTVGTNLHWFSRNYDKEENNVSLHAWNDTITDEYYITVGKAKGNVAARKAGAVRLWNHPTLFLECVIRTIYNIP